MPGRRWKFRIRHILEAIETIRTYTSALSFETFSQDRKTIHAVVYNLAVIGEAARHIPSDAQDAHPQIPWAEMRGMRNVMVHEYHRVEPRVIWETVQRDLPPLVPALEGVLKEKGEQS